MCTNVIYIKPIGYSPNFLLPNARKESIHQTFPPPNFPAMQYLTLVELIDCCTCYRVVFHKYLLKWLILDAHYSFIECGDVSVVCTYIRIQRDK